MKWTSRPISKVIIDKKLWTIGCDKNEKFIKLN